LVAHPGAGIIATTGPCLDGVLRVLEVLHAWNEWYELGRALLHDGFLTRQASALKLAIGHTLHQWALNIGIWVPGAQVGRTLKDAGKELDMAPIASELRRVIAKRRVLIDYAIISQTDTGAAAKVDMVILEVNHTALRSRTLNWLVFVRLPRENAVILYILALLCARIGVVMAAVQERRWCGALHNGVAVCLYFNKTKRT